MRIVVGLGNPGKRYAETRHNVGFMVAARMMAMIGATGVRERFDAEMTEGRLGDQKVILLCPLTYMNASGRSVRQAVDFYQLTAEHVLVVCDDMNLPLGRLRIRARGSAGGQKGLADVIRQLGTEEVPRLRIGIDPPPPGWAAPDYVLSKFKPGERGAVDSVVDRAAAAAADWIEQGTAFCMNRYNAEPA